MRTQHWITEGFEDFRKGTFGNSGQNLYVSLAGVLQRIYQHDLRHDGFFPLVFANCQNHHESAESYVYDEEGRRTELPGQGALCGLVADLTGNGWNDIVVGGYYDMAAPYASTDIYFGSPEGYSQKNHIRIPTPWAEDCCCGHFDGSGKPCLAFALTKYKIIRVFFQTELGFEWKRYQDFSIEANSITAADLDGDGYDELIVRQKDKTETTVYWGGADGISVERFTVLPELPESEVVLQEKEDTLKSEMEKEFEPPRLMQKVRWDDRNCFTLLTGKKVLFYSSDKSRELQCVFSLEVPMALQVAIADFNNDGRTDLAISARAKLDDSQKRYSFIYFNGPEGFSQEHRITLETTHASCVSATEDAVLFGQCTNGFNYTNDALLFSFREGKLDPLPKRFEGEDMRRVSIFRNPDGKRHFFLLNHYSRRAVGFDKTYVYWGSKAGYDPKNRLEVPCWCAVDSFSADVDDDGWAELIVCNNSENSLHLDTGHHLHHFGTEGFQPEKSRSILTNIGWGAVVADFDRDGSLEIVSICDTWRKLRYYHGGPDHFEKFEDISLGMDDLQYGGGRWILAVDLNNDGWLDLVIPVITSDRSLILWGGPEGFSMERHSELAVMHGVCARAADLTGNGYPDLIVGGHTHNIYGGDTLPHEPHHSFVHIYWNGPDGLSEQRKTILRADAASAIAVADFNQDGWLDIFSCSYHGGKDRDINSFLYWNRNGHFHELDRDLLYTHSASGCIAADFDQDGWPDLAVANHKVDGDHLGFSTVWWNGPDGFNPKKVTNLPTCGPHGMSSIEPGNLLTRGAEEFYYSAPHKCIKAARIINVKIEGEIPPQTWVKLLVRSAGSPDHLDKADWLQPDQLQGFAGDYLQYCLELGATLSLRSPRITKVDIELQE